MAKEGAMIVEDRVVSIGSVKLVKNIYKYYDIVEVLDIFESQFSKKHIISVKSLVVNNSVYNISSDDILGNIVQLSDEFYEHCDKIRQH